MSYWPPVPACMFISNSRVVKLMTWQNVVAGHSLMSGPHHEERPLTATESISLSSSMPPYAHPYLIAFNLACVAHLRRLYLEPGSVYPRPGWHHTRSIKPIPTLRRDGKRTPSATGDRPRKGSKITLTDLT